MTAKESHNHEEIIQNIIAQLDKKTPAKQAKLITKFIENYYAKVSLDELSQCTAPDLYGAALNFWHFMAERKAHEAKVRVYNPQYEQDGWESSHTVVDVNCDDMPFLVDSLRMEINREGYGVYGIVHFGGFEVKRDDVGHVVEIIGRTQHPDKRVAEAVIHIEIDRQTDEKVLAMLQARLEMVLADVASAVHDWQPMRDKVQELLDELEKNHPPIDKEEVEESKNFLRWIKDDHFTFLGCRDYRLVQQKGQAALELEPDTGLGVLRDESASRKIRPLNELPPEAQELFLSKKNLLILAKTNTPSTIHRDVRTDCIEVKRLNAKGEIIGERRFVGLYTTAAYHSNPQYIPFVRHKVETVLNKSGLSRSGHGGKDLLHILQTLPRDDLFQASTEELFELAMGILQLQERRVIRLFVRKDVYGRFISCLVYMPKESFNNELRRTFQGILEEAFDSKEIAFNTYFSESILARIHFLIHTDSKKPLHYDVKEIQGKLIEASHSWKDQLRANLIEARGEEKGIALFNRYGDAFPAGYREDFHPRHAVYDIAHIEYLTATHSLEMNFYHAVDEADNQLGFKLFHAENTIPLSDVVPIFENLGLRIIGERPYNVKTLTGQSFWIDDFDMVYSDGEPLELDKVRDIFQEAFANIWYGLAENDGFNKLILAARLNWRQVSVLRAYAKYLRQTGFMFSQSYIEETLARYPLVARSLVELFELHFQLNAASNKAEKISMLDASIKQEIEKVASLDEDRILRRYLDVIYATLRTNYFQHDQKGQPKSYFSFKLKSSAIPELPQPLPLYEIFVYSPRFEAVHLRSSKVARGGIRWSDRREDFRTEVLGLMKAQKVKNSVIVPSGAKGGFVPKCLPQEASREDIMNEVVGCYKNFMRGLLDITDNLVLGKVVPPKDTICYDDADPYLVVAADKGTASFSDIANGIAKEYNFWLGDAFASGGSVGYDHKKMGITARGAWESVKRHFRELNIDIRQNDFTVVGIGDMSGDVFGNGMLRSKHIKLVAAFDHRHIFIDPNPDAAISFAERERLFNLPRSSWADYNAKLISKGGGVFSRASKSIVLTPEVKERFALDVDQINPNDLIKALLKAQVDLLWNGGIGTYVKASSERHADIGDRTNDFVRVNGNELRCKVVGEGGNLGFSQLARVEYVLNNGRCYTDFIDNSAGVDCSDHEVNIKILLNQIVMNGDLTEKQRNVLLAEMTDEIAELVLKDNYDQTLAVSVTGVHAKTHAELFRRYLSAQEKLGLIDRDLEFLPSDKTLVDRRNQEQSLTAPELAVLISYSKINLKNEVLDSDLTEDAYVEKFVETAFPPILRKRYPEHVYAHSLHREIIATQLSNSVVNEMGPTFIHRLNDETGVTVPEIMRAYLAAAQIFRAKEMQALINSLDYQIPAGTQIEMLLHIERLVRRATRWLLRHRRVQLDITANIAYFSEGVTRLTEIVPALMVGVTQNYMQQLTQQFVAAGLAESIASRIASCRAMYMALNIVDVATQHQFDLLDTAKVFFGVGARLELVWFRDQLNAEAQPEYWDSLARASLRDDLDIQQRMLTISMMQHRPDITNMDERMDSWMEKHQILVARWQTVLTNLRISGQLGFSRFFVAARELADLTKMSLEAAPVIKGSKKGRKATDAKAS